MIKILNAEPKEYSREAFEILASLAGVVERPLTQQELLECIHEFDVLIVRLGLRIDKELLAKAKNLKFILTATTGTDHIDIAEAKKLNIEIVSLKGEIDFLNTIPSTAEHTWALLLSLTRNLPQAFEDVKSGNWNRQKFKGRNLRSKRLGLLGLGRVGKQVAKFGQCFGMEVGAFDPFQAMWVEDVIKFQTVENLLSWGDVLSIHIPFDTTTENFLDKHKCAHIKNGAFIINTSRGGVWEEESISALLKSGHLAGVATDVITNEQYDTVRKTNPLLNLLPSVNNLIITPHIAGATVESMEMTEIFIAKKFINLLKANRECAV